MGIKRELAKLKKDSFFVRFKKDFFVSPSFGVNHNEPPLRVPNFNRLNLGLHCH